MPSTTGRRGLHPGHCFRTGATWAEVACFTSCRAQAISAESPCPPLPASRCAGGGGQLPQPTLVLESEGPLQYDEAEWEQGWVSQGGEQVYTVRMRMSGHPG